MRLFILGLAAAFSASASAELDINTLTCTIRYEIQVAPGQVKYVAPKNADKQSRIFDIKFCNNGDCKMKKVASAFTGDNSIGGASARIVGDKTTIVIRDGAGNRTAMIINTAGLVPMESGAPVFMLNADGWYNGELMTGIYYSCWVQP